MATPFALFSLGRSSNFSCYNSLWQRLSALPLTERHFRGLSVSSNRTSTLISPLDEVFRLLVDEITDYAIFLLTPTGEIATWNPGAERFKGYKASEIIGKHFRKFYTEQDQLSRRPEHNLEMAAKHGRFEDEGWRVRKDGSRFWASVIITAIHDHQRRLIGFGKVTKDLTERKQAEEQLRELSSRVLKAQEDERSRLGRELHDSIGQYLVAVKMNLDRLDTQKNLDESKTRAHIRDCSVSLERAIQEVRTMSYLLYPPMLEETGLPMAIRWHLDGFSTRSGIKATYDIAPETTRLSHDAELALFRVFQESLTNVHRHSQSTTVHIRLTMENGNVLLEIKDQGKGMPAASKLSKASEGVGIRGMRERLRQLNGKLEVNSTAKGTTVKATVPIN